jgi:hypothetical protein
LGACGASASSTSAATAASIVRISSAATTNGGSVGATTIGGGGAVLEVTFDKPFQRATTIQGVVVAAVNGEFETCHDIGGLVAIQVGLADPSKVRGVNVIARG